jgi:hypothetical protein
MATNPLTLCPLIYKSPACGYKGDLPDCGKTFGDCVTRANTVNFGGLPSSDADAIVEMFPNGVPLDDSEKRELGLLPCLHIRKQFYGGVLSCKDCDAVLRGKQ